jgi:hypothetical protein
VGDGRVDERGGTVGRAHVHRQGDEAVPLAQLGEVLARGPCTCDDMSTLLGEETGYGQADAPAGAGDDDDLSSSARDP